jgi:hypothetical protein
MLLFIYIGVISKNKLNSSIMKKVVLTLALAVTGVINAQLEYYEQGVYIDTTVEKGSFDNPYIVDDMLDADPYDWFYVDNDDYTTTEKGMYGMKEDMIEYAYEIINDFGNGKYNYDERGSENITNWDIVTDNGTHYDMHIILFDKTAELYINELSHEEHIERLKLFKYYYKKTYGKEKYKEWLGK